MKSKLKLDPSLEGQILTVIERYGAQLEGLQIHPQGLIHFLHMSPQSEQCCETPALTVSLPPVDVGEEITGIHREVLSAVVTEAKKAAGQNPLISFYGVSYSYAALGLMLPARLITNSEKPRSFAVLFVGRPYRESLVIALLVAFKELGADAKKCRRILAESLDDGETIWQSVFAT